jgi:hypothetical protein
MMVSSVSNDVGILSEAILTLFDVVSFLFLCVMYYLVFVGNAISLKYWRRRKKLVGVLAANPIVAAFIVIPAHLFADRRDLLLALIALVIGVVIYAVFYFFWIRPFIRSADFRIQSTVMMWGAMAALTVSSLLFLYLGRDFIKMETRPEISYDLLIHSASILISALGIAFTYVMRSEQANRNSKQQLYQTLELQSIELFRFECEKPDLVRQLWFETPDQPETGETSRYCLRQYVCQMLNLFEMATRFRTSRVLPEDVFGSWVIWIWELCNCEKFQELWLDEDDLPSNYIRDFRDVVTAGVQISLGGKGTPQTRRDDFFREVAERLNCWEIEQWFAGRPDVQLSLEYRYKGPVAEA